ncbi:LamG domain-containing protein [Spirosoma fluviale]|uniref:Concanavalin A-like lectin/glucanases superfamily protein n=1 Tax=Spirosoma fluviale TaxID=1597977 RepID=A0A286G9U7_9BACT|nr:LamG domain-containing protein [Spirosoma fluviale]SOD92313.1 Concanavalin A-like lectin/glucanases superfamily protein [Spirosoma fluviale]
MICRTLCVVALILFFASYSFGQTTSQLIACYPFSGDAKDGFGPNHGTVNGATLTTDRFNKPNSAYFFDRNSYIDLPAAPFTNPTYTLSAWVKLASFPAQADAFTIFSFSEPNQCLTLTNQPVYGGNVWNFFSYNTTGSVITTQSVSIGTWTHLTAIQADSALIFYINGERAQTVKITPTAPLSYTCPLQACIGIRPTRGTLIQPFHGAIDDVRVYRGILSDAEVRVLYQATTCQTDFTLNPITAQPFVSLRNGNWNDPTVWSCGCIPTATDAVQVRHVVTVPPAFQANALRVYINGAAQITYGLGGRLVLSL